jgi:hypothetical protein
MVLGIDQGTPRRQWKMAWGRLKQFILEKDGNVRVVDVRENHKIFRRSIRRVSPLEFRNH